MPNLDDHPTMVEDKSCESMGASATGSRSCRIRQQGPEKPPYSWIKLYFQGLSQVLLQPEVLLLWHVTFDSIIYMMIEYFV